MNRPAGVIVPDFVVQANGGWQGIGPPNWSSATAWYCWVDPLCSVPGLPGVMTIWENSWLKVTSTELRRAQPTRVSHRYREGVRAGLIRDDGHAARIEAVIHDGRRPGAGGPGGQGPVVGEAGRRAILRPAGTQDRGPDILPENSGRDRDYGRARSYDLYTSVTMDLTLAGRHHHRHVGAWRRVHPGLRDHAGRRRPFDMALQPKLSAELVVARVACQVARCLPARGSIPGEKP